MAINKVVYGNQTLIDLTADTVTESDVAQGVTFHDASGQQRVGTGGGSSGHHYSTTEQVVGTWIDGKTLYERVVQFNQIILNTDSWFNTGIDCTNMHSLVTCQGFWDNGTRLENNKPIGGDISGSTLTIQRMRNTTDYVTGLILQYTKVTD